jgi:hypothetical protein
MMKGRFQVLGSLLFLLALVPASRPAQPQTAVTSL